jgi:hypothetical protein
MCRIVALVVFYLWDVRIIARPEALIEEIIFQNSLRDIGSTPLVFVLKTGVKESG